MENNKKVGHLIVIEGGRDKKTTVKTSKRGRPSENPLGLAGPPDFTIPPDKQPRADYLLSAEQVAEQLHISKSQVRRLSFPSTLVTVETGRRTLHYRQIDIDSYGRYARERLEVPPDRKERVVGKINQLETRKGMLTSGATELLRSLRVELGKIEGQEKSAR